MKKKSLILVFALAIFTLSISKEVKAQDYHSGVGVSLGYPLGFEYKQFMSSKSAISASFGYTPYNRLMLFNATYQRHVPVYENLNLYFGGGLSIGSIYSHNEFVMGFTPNVGIEYKIPSAPIAVAVDYKPVVSFTTRSQFNQAALKLFYTF